MVRWLRLPLSSYSLPVISGEGQRLTEPLAFTHQTYMQMPLDRDQNLEVLLSLQVDIDLNTYESNAVLDLLQILRLAYCHTKRTFCMTIRFYYVKSNKKDYFSKEINAVTVKLLIKIKVHSYVTKKVGSFKDKISQQQRSNFKLQCQTLNLQG